MSKYCKSDNNILSLLYLFNIIFLTKTPIKICKVSSKYLICDLCPVLTQKFTNHLLCHFWT